ncbi:MAG TPA: hypothetical protein VFZ49_04265 [Pyrinomonadaceae bacterium]
MRSKIFAIALMAAFALIALPTESLTVEAQRGRQKSSLGSRHDSRRGNGQGNKKWYPRRYKNYGQYRRTQVGNRRYRWERRYYYRDGRRRSRLIRIYF